jgi:hypothetical protein
MDELFTAAIIGAVTLFIGLSGTLIMLNERRIVRRTTEQVEEAERHVFKELPAALDAKLEALAVSQEGLERKTHDLAMLIEQSRTDVRLGALLNLYSKQIEKYQQQTQIRASSSFTFAILSMLAGLGFVVWGGYRLMGGQGWDSAAAGTALAAIGGAVSAFITKTFLDVHRLSLSQLNRYFTQPVLNEQLLNAQRLADDLGDEPARRTAYAEIIATILQLVRAGGGLAPTLPVQPRPDPA